MLENLKKVGFTLLLTFIVTSVISYCLTPYSALNFVGPFGAVATSLFLLWGTSFSLLVIATLIIAAALFHFVLGYSITAELSFISLLAICLQGYWTKMLTADEMKDEAWLSARTELASFLFKVGPLGAIVPAIAVTIVAVLKNQVFDYGLVFLFFSHWSLSLLIAVFVVSMVLFSQTKLDISRYKRGQVLLASTLGLVAIGIMFKVTQRDVQYQRVDAFNAAERAIKVRIIERIDMVEEQLHALAAFHHASEKISAQEFDIFSDFIFHEDSGIKMFAWAPAVETSYVDQYHADIQRISGFQHYQIRPLDPSKLIKERLRYHMPLRYVYPDELVEHYLGIDLIAHAENKVAMEQAAQLKRTVATLPLRMDLVGLENANIFVFYPLYRSKLAAPYLLEDDNFEGATGFLLAVVDVFEMFSLDLVLEHNHQDVLLHISDVSSSTPIELFGTDLVTTNRLVRHTETLAFDRTWRITIVEKEPWDVHQRGWLTWGIMIGGTLGGLLYQFLILLIMTYSTELKQQIALKTRELILEKENSDKVSQAKSEYLSMLSQELKVPVSGISGYIEQFKNEPDCVKDVVPKLEAATDNLSHFVQMVKDMSQLETGQLELSNQTFDFHEFAARMESMSNAATDPLVRKAAFVVHKDVPQYLIGDELRIQQVFNALIRNGAMIFNCDSLRVSVKAHMHKHDSTTIFIAVSPHESIGNHGLNEKDMDEEFAHLNTSMTLAQEICHHLGGSIKLSPLQNKEYLISATFKAEIANKDPLSVKNEVIDKYQQV